MNANELADALDNDWADKFRFDAATMLRQQQNEIAELEIGLKNVWKVVEGKQTEIESLESELDRAVELYTDKAIENEALHRFIDERGETGQLIIWKAQK